MKSFFVVFAFFYLMIPSHASAQIDTYDFTTDFITCVKRYSAEHGEFVRHGNSESSLMNGRSVLPSSELDSSYWDYMNCLTLARGGTSSTSSIQTLYSCPEREITYAGGRVYIPPGLEGKRVGISNYFFECTSGGWVNITSDVIDPISGNEITTPPQNENCAPEIKRIGNCTFEFGVVENGYNAEDYFGQSYGDNDAQHEGYALATCSNGELNTVRTSCQLNLCVSGEKLFWGSPSPIDGRWASCSGEVALDGVVELEPQPRRYYSSLLQALENTKVVTGNAEFKCESGSWRVDSSASTCKIKPVNELDCGFEGSGEDRKYYCE